MEDREDSYDETDGGEVNTNVENSDAAIAIARRRGCADHNPSTSCGRGLHRLFICDDDGDDEEVVLLYNPNCPLLLSPQQYTCPSFVMATL